MARKKTPPPEGATGDLLTRLRGELSAAQSARRRTSEMLARKLESLREYIDDSLAALKEGRCPNALGVFQGNAPAADVMCAELKYRDEAVKRFEWLVSLIPPVTTESTDG